MSEVQVKMNLTFEMKRRERKHPENPRPSSQLSSSVLAMGGFSRLWFSDTNSSCVSLCYLMQTNLDVAEQNTIKVEESTLKKK